MGVIRTIAVNDAFVVLKMHISILHLQNTTVEDHHTLYEMTSHLTVRLILVLKQKTAQFISLSKLYFM